MLLGTEVGLGPADIVMGLPHGKGTEAPPPHTFRLMSIVAKRSPISVTAELLLWSPYGIEQTIIFCAVVCLWLPYVIGQAIYIFILSFVLCFFSFLA